MAISMISRRCFPSRLRVSRDKQRVTHFMHGGYHSSKEYKRFGMATKKTKSDPKRWTKHVMETSNALDLEQGVFTWDDPHEIALSLQRSAEHSQRRKSSPFRSAMSMLTFHIN